jgi:hypothetical protein
MSNLSTAAIFIIILDLILVVCGLAITNISPTGTVCVTPQETMLSDYQTDASFSNDPSVILPSSNTGAVANPGNFVTDITNMIVGSIKKIPILNKILSIVTAPFTILSCTKILPTEFVNMVSGAWWIISSLLIFAWIAWRD